MDSITEKFGVFDFFNLLIAGIVSLSILEICHYDQMKKMTIKVIELIGESNFYSIIAFIGYIGFALSIGAFFQVIGQWIIRDKIGWEKGIIRTCLNIDGVLKNCIRRKKLQRYAQQYLQLSDGERELTAEENEAFFAHCEYVHVNCLDKKTEKLRETQGLSELLMFVFWSIPVFSTMVFIFRVRILGNVNVNDCFVAVIYILCVIFGFIFCYRYKISAENRIRMVLSIYEAYKEEKT